jgi:hypothetical protein
MKTILLTILIFSSLNGFAQKYQATQKTYVKEVENKIDSEKTTTRGNFIFEIKDDIILLTSFDEKLRYPIQKIDTSDFSIKYKVQNDWSIKIINHAAIIIRWSDNDYTVYNHVIKLE